MTCALATQTLGPNASVNSSIVAILLALKTDATWMVKWSPLGDTDLSMDWACPRVLKEGLAAPSSTHTRCESPKSAVLFTILSVPALIWLGQLRSTSTGGPLVA